MVLGNLFKRVFISVFILHSPIGNDFPHTTVCVCVWVCLCVLHLYACNYSLFDRKVLIDERRFALTSLQWIHLEKKLLCVLTIDVCKYFT